MPVHPGDPDHSVLGGLCVDRALAAARVAEDRGHRRVSWKGEIRERPVIPDAGWRELGPRAGTVIVVWCLGGDGPGRARIVLRIAELHHVEGWAADLLDVEVVAPAVRIDCHIGMHPARDGLDGSSLTTLVQMVSAGIGVTLIPEMAVSVETPAAEVCIAQFPAPSPSRQIGMIWRKSNPLHAHLTQVAEVVKRAGIAK